MTLTEILALVAVLISLLTLIATVVHDTFDIAWKVLKDILVKKLEILDFAIGSPRETLQQAFTNGLIDDDRWLQMLKTRNYLAHDYDGTFAEEKFRDIVEIYCPLFEKMKQQVKKYYDEM